MNLLDKKFADITTSDMDDFYNNREELNSKSYDLNTVIFINSIINSKINYLTMCMSTIEIQGKKHLSLYGYIHEERATWLLKREVYKALIKKIMQTNYQN